MMEIFSQKREMHAFTRDQQIKGKRVALVPTMGALHEGHLSLIRVAREHADTIVLSIYVNPTQFAPHEDLSTYPRDTEGDLAKAAREGVDAVFMPSNEEMYPQGFETSISVQSLATKLCGITRPTHFSGVLTVVAKLFHIVSPDLAIFGEKDFQQLVIIRRMVEDLDMPIEVIGAPIIREADGLAMSSRNQYLSPDERLAARALSRSLAEARQAITGGMTNVTAILQVVKALLDAEPLLRLDYAQLVDAETLEDLSILKRPALLALAAFVGKTRLIDNLHLPRELEPSS